MSQVDAIRNPEGIWINSNCFREEGLFFQKNGYYTPELWGSPAWMDYWKEQLRRCTEGYSVGGAYITGHHYFYLNFTQIMLTKEKGDSELIIAQGKKNKASKQLVCPDFWDGDYNYFHCLDIASNGCTEQELKDLQLHVTIDPKYLTGGYHMIVGKARRRGYSYKNGSICANIYNTIPDSLSIIGAFDKKYLYPRGTMGMTSRYLDHINKHTGWRKAREYVDKQEHRKASYRQYKNGVPIESGYMSEVIALTFKDNPDAAHPYSEIIYTPNGKKQWKDIHVGDTIFNEKGSTTKVTEIIEKGIKPIYEFTFNDGRKIKSTEDHKWNIIRRCYSANKSKNNIKEQKEFVEKTLTTKELFNILNNTTKNNKPKIRIPEAINFNEQLVPIDAYTLGLLLGDGCFTRTTKNKAYITMMWSDINSLSEHVPYEIINLAWDKNNKKQNQIVINDCKSIFKELNLLDKYSHNKFIPDVYKYNSKEVRLNILNGLLDTDGSITKDYGVIEYSTKSNQLAEDVLFICYSLGLGAKKCKKIVDGKIYYRIYIYCKPDNKSLFKLKRKNIRLDLKKDNAYAVNKSTYIQIEKAEIIGYENSKCINVDNKSSLYLIGDFITTHNCRGKDAKLILFEEAGKFPNLKDSYMATKESLEDGAFVTGQMVIFGTGGDMEDGTIDFADMFFNPEEYDLMPFVNIWDKDATNTNCGFFHPETWNLVGFYDEQGNSQIEKAEKYELAKRDNLRKVARSSYVLQKRVQEKPLCPQEAFLTTSTNDFPIAELQNQLDIVRRDNLFSKMGTPVQLYRDENNKVRIKPDLDKTLIPLNSYKIKDEDISGCVVLFEPPIGNPPPAGLYKIGHDPYRQNQAETSTSLGATYVRKGFQQGSHTSDTIVASYIGRPTTSDEYNRTLEMLAELYNAKIGYENEVTEVKSYFEKRKKLHYLELQPDAIISANIKNSKVARVYGIHMHEKLKDAGEKYIKRWLLTVRNVDEDGKQILNLNTIYDIGLLEELIQYNRKGNFDRVMSFMILIFFIEDEDARKQIVTDNTSKKELWNNFATNLFKYVN